MYHFLRAFPKLPRATTVNLRWKTRCFSRSLCALTLLALALLFFAAPAQAQEMFLTLEGETFQSKDLKTAKVSCSSTGKSGQLDFSAQGTAGGPFTGIFTETGTILFDEFSNLITGGAISFTIVKEDGKTFGGRKTPIEGKILCSVDQRTGLTTIQATISTLEYAAGLDSGTATLDLFASIDPALGLTTLKFTEIFYSSHVTHATPGKVTGGGNITYSDRNSGITFGFNAQNNDNGMKGSGTIIDHNAGVKVKILDVQTFFISGTHATFTGKADVNGVEGNYRIDIDDLGEPGASVDSFKIVTDSYGGGGTLAGGNIQVHK